MINAVKKDHLKDLILKNRPEQEIIHALLEVLAPTHILNLTSGAHGVTFQWDLGEGHHTNILCKWATARKLLNHTSHEEVTWAIFDWTLKELKEEEK